jgi:hypothetical protein
MGNAGGEAGLDDSEEETTEVWYEQQHFSNTDDARYR